MRLYISIAKVSRSQIIGALPHVVPSFTRPRVFDTPNDA